MCGRYSQTADLKTLVKRFSLEGAAVEVSPRWNLAPSQEAPVVVEEEGRRLVLMRWGLVPSWAKDPSIGHKMINARCETLSEKPSFHKAFERRRCLIPADGFYEWRKAGAAKVATRIVLKSREPFAFAGLWETWKKPEGGDLSSFTIVTTSASETLRSLHDRMPVILKPEAESRWLDCKAGPQDLRQFLLPYPDELLEAYEVSPLVNSPKNDTPDCAKPARRPTGR